MGAVFPELVVQRAKAYSVDDIPPENEVGSVLDMVSVDVRLTSTDYTSHPVCGPDLVRPELVGLPTQSRHRRLLFLFGFHEKSSSCDYTALHTSGAKVWMGLRLYNGGMNIQEIIRVQSVLGTTRTGRVIGKRLVDVLVGIVNSGSFPDPADAMDCRNCHLVMPNKQFESGCPNCGCKNELDSCAGGVEQVKKAVDQ